MLKMASVRFRIEATCEACGAVFFYNQVISESGSGFSNPAGAVRHRLQSGDLGVRKCPSCGYRQSWMERSWKRRWWALFGLRKMNGKRWRKHGDRSFPRESPSVSPYSGKGWDCPCRAKLVSAPQEVVPTTVVGAPTAPAPRRGSGRLRAIFLAWLAGVLAWLFAAVMCSLILINVFGLTREMELYGRIRALVILLAFVGVFVLVYRRTRRRDTKEQAEAPTTQPSAEP